MNESSTFSPAVLSATYVHHGAGVKAVACSPDGRTFASADLDRHVAIWRDGQILREHFPLHRWELFPSGKRIYCLAFSLDGSKLFVGMTDRLEAYDVESGRRLWRFRGPKVLAFLPSSPVGLAVNPATGDVAAGFDDGHMGIWTPEGECRGFWYDDQGPRHLAYNSNGSRLIGTDFYSICIWDTLTFAKVARHMGEEKYPALAVSAIADVVAVRTLRELLLFEGETGDERYRVPVGAGLPLLALSSTAPVVAYTNGEHLLFMDFDGNLISTAITGCVVLSLAFTADGTRLLAGCRDGRVLEVPTSAAKQGGRAEFVPPA